LITSGVPILEGLSITARTSGNAVLEEALMKVRKAIEEGRTIVDPLRESGVFPNMVTQMIGVGEATGAMDSMLQKGRRFLRRRSRFRNQGYAGFVGTSHHRIPVGLCGRRHRYFAVYAAVLADRQDGRLSTKHPGRSTW
jgi:hypothetical protein